MGYLALKKSGSCEVINSKTKAISFSEDLSK